MNRLRHRLLAFLAIAPRVAVIAVVAVAPAGLPGSARAAAQVPAVGLEVMLVIDASGSMRPAIEAAKAAAREFVDSMPAEVPIGVVTFGDDVTVLTPPTTDRPLLSEEINSIVTVGDTALYDAVIAASQQFSLTADYKVIVLLSDGKDEGSGATLDAAIAASQGVSIEAISLTTAQTDIASLSALGTVTSADDTAGVSAAFARVASHLAAVVGPVMATTSLTPSTTVEASTTTVAVSTTTVAVSTAAVAPSTTSLAPVASLPPRPAAPVAVDSPSATASPVTLWLGALGVFLGLLLLGLLFFPRARVSKARLGIDKPRSVSDMGKRAVSVVDQALERRGKRADLATKLAAADISMQPAEFVGVVAVVAVVLGLVGLLLAGPPGALLTAAVVCVGARVYLNRTKARHQAAFAAQLPDVLQLVTTSLRSGFGLAQALDSVAEEAEEPARSAFAQVLVESRLGRDLPDAMRALARRMDSHDLEWVVGAIEINRDTGGNLSEIFRTVGATIRERQRLVRLVASLTA